MKLESDIVASMHENDALSKEYYDNQMYLLKGAENKAKLEHRFQRDE